MPRPHGKSARIVAFALWAGAGVLGALGAAFYGGLLPVADESRGLLAGLLGAVAVLDALIGFWFFRASLDA